MEDISYIRSLALSSLAITTRRLLSNLLDSTKVLRTEGPIKRHRDWRGLASLVNISSELESTIWNYNDKTGRVLELWMQSQAGTVGELLDHLMTLDRFDVYDDIIESIREHRQKPENQVALVNNKQNNSNQIALVDDHELITFEDRPGHSHYYHAYVLYADENKDFVMEMKARLNSHGFELCMKDNLLPGYASQFPPVSRLISERCKRIVLVYSPEFLQCHDNTFFRDYTQALSIRLDRRIMLPIMYKKCELPYHLSIYWQLYYNTDDLDNFWDRLVKSMEVTRYALVSTTAPAAAPQNATQQQYNNSSSTVNIHTMSNSAPHSYSQYFLPSANTVPIVSLAPSNVSHAPSTVSLPQSVASQMNTTRMLIIPPKKKKSKNVILRKLSKMFNMGKKKEKIVDTLKPQRAEQLCA